MEGMWSDYAVLPSTYTYCAVYAYLCLNVALFAYVRVIIKESRARAHM